MYKVVISPKAKSQLKKISKETHRNAISQAIDELKSDPLLGKLLTRDLTGKYSYRVGVYRIIYKIRKEDKMVLIISAGHRSAIYD